MENVSGFVLLVYCSQNIFPKVFDKECLVKATKFHKELFFRLKLIKGKTKKIKVYCNI